MNPYFIGFKLDFFQKIFYGLLIKYCFQVKAIVPPFKSVPSILYFYEMCIPGPLSHDYNLSNVKHNFPVHLSNYVDYM